MYATYTCEQCFSEHNNESDFVQCSGDACHECVCKECAKKCKNPECKRWVCDNCLQGQSAKYAGEYCIKCAMWSTDKDGEWKNFDFVKRKMTHAEGLAYLDKKNKGHDDGAIRTSEDLCNKLKKQLS